MFITSYFVKKLLLHRTASTCLLLIFMFCILHSTEELFYVYFVLIPVVIQHIRIYKTRSNKCVHAVLCNNIFLLLSKQINIQSIAQGV